MTPSMALVIAQLVLKYGPDIALGIAEIFQKESHTLEDWKSVFGKLKTYEQIMAAPVSLPGEPPVFGK